MKKEYIREFSGRILGIVETDSEGNQTVRDFNSLQILGYYRVRDNATTDFYGRIVSYGNTAVVFLYVKNR